MARKTPAAIQALRADAARLRKLGTKGDTVLAHINPREAALLDWLPDRRINNPVNPRTGLPTFSDGSGQGTSGGGGGDDGNNGAGSVGGPGGSTSGGGSVGGPGDPGPGSSYSSGAGYGFSDAPASPGFGPNGEGLSIGDVSGFGGPPSATIGPNGEGMDSFASPVGALTSFGIESTYAPLGTWTRRFQELVSPSRPHERWGAPTGANPNAARTVAGILGGGLLSGLMGFGAAMDRAATPEERAASMAEQEARGRENSTGHDAALPQRQLAEWIADSNQPAKPPGPAPTVQGLAGGDNLLTKLLLRPGPLGGAVGLLGWPG